MAEVYPGINGIIAHLAPVKAEVAAISENRAAIARGLLLKHTKSGKTEIVVEHHKLDSVVSMVNPRGIGAVMAIEFGWHHGSSHGEGLHILGRAFGI